MSFKRKNDFTQFNTMTDFPLQKQLTSARVSFPPAFKNMTLLFDITRFLALAIIIIGEVY